MEETKPGDQGYSFFWNCSKIDHIVQWGKAGIHPSRPEWECLPAFQIRLALQGHSPFEIQMRPILTEQEVISIDEEGLTWMTHIQLYIKARNLP